MKKINIFLIFSLIILSFVACNNDDENLKLNSGDLVTPSFEMQSEQGFEVTVSTDQTQQIGTWKWTEAVFGVQSPITYVLVADTLESFATEVEIVRYTTHSKDEPITIKMLNDAAASLTKESREVTLYVTVKAILGTSGNTGALYSSKKTVTFTCYYFNPKDALYIVGDGLVGWDNTIETIGNNLQVFFADNSGKADMTYTYTGFFKGGKGLKFPTLAGDWNTAYGYSGGSLVANGGDNYPTPATDGLYTLTVNLNSLAISMEPYTGDVKSYGSIGIIGDGAKGWGDSDDVVMTKYAEHVWVAKSVELNQSGTIKFRADAAWTDDWGAMSDDGQELPFTQGKYKGSNISVLKSGKYFVAFNDLTSHYVIIPEDNLPIKKEE